MIYVRNFQVESVTSLSCVILKQQGLYFFGYCILSLNKQSRI